MWRRRATGPYVDVWQGRPHHDIISWRLRDWGAGLDNSHCWLLGIVTKRGQLPSALTARPTSPHQLGSRRSQTHTKATHHNRISLPFSMPRKKNLGVIYPQRGPTSHPFSTGLIVAWRGQAITILSCPSTATLHMAVPDSIKHSSNKTSTRWKKSDWPAITVLTV